MVTKRYRKTQHYAKLSIGDSVKETAFARLRTGTNEQRCVHFWPPGHFLSKGAYMGDVIEIIAYYAAVWVVVQTVVIMRKQRPQNVKQHEKFPFITIIIPVRNEENNIGTLLASLKKIDYPNFEIIVSDDSSTDRTVAISNHFNVQVLLNETKPPGWIGKSWACWQAAQVARGEYILFTDADTSHKSDSLVRAIAFLQSTNSSLISAGQFHRNELWWEKYLGPFYCLLNIGVQNKKESTGNPYAIGQYLLIERNAYFTFGGHKTIRSEVADDAALAKAVMETGLTYRLYKGKPLCTIQMYRSFEEFVNGWTRILRLGMQELRTVHILGAVVPLLALNVHNLFEPVVNFQSILPVVTVMIAFSFLQRSYGNFSIVGILLFPAGLLLFLAVSISAFIHHIMNAPISWKGRTYSSESPSQI